VTAWTAWVRHDAVRRWRGAVLLALFVALAGGVVLSAFVGARRGATSLDRLTARTHPATAMALPNEPGFDWKPVGELPYVRAMQTFVLAFYSVAGHEDASTDFPRGAPPVGDVVEQQVAVAGRLADQSRADEITINPEFHAAAGVDIGDELTLQLFPATAIQAALSGEEAPPPVPAAEVRARVVGVAKGTFFSGDVQPTLAFYQQHRELLAPIGIGYANAVVTLAGGTATIPRLEADLERIAGRPIEVMSLPDLEIGDARTALHLETGGLLAFAVAALGAAIVFGGIALLRGATSSAADVEALHGLGFTRRQTIAAAATTPALAILAGAAGACVVAWALSDRYPIGQGRVIEPSPGRHANVALLVAGFAGLAVIGIGGELLAARRALRRADAGVPPPSRLASLLAVPGATMPLALGAGLATERRRSAGGPAATAALTIGIAAVVAALTFGAGLDRGSRDGMLTGQPFDSLTVRVGATELPDDVVAAWRADDRIAAAARLADAVVTLDGRAVAVFAVTDLKGRFDDHPLRGRVPAATEEIAFAPKEMARLGLDLGDTLSGPDGIQMRVVGEVFTPEVSHTSYDEGARVTPARLAALVATGAPVKFDALALRWAPGVDPESVADDAWRGIGHDRGGLVDNQRNLSSTRPLPRLFAGLVAVLSVAATAYAVHATARRRRREVAVLQVLGLTRRQARATVAWHVAVAAAIALIVGIPLGFAIGRTLWESVADAVPLRYVTPGAWALVAAAAAVLLTAIAIVVVRPIERAGRDEPATLLRAE
jgi:FtsX-like permease family/MacB-like periplasmic core domain